MKTESRFNRSIPSLLVLCAVLTLFLLSMCSKTTEPEKPTVVALSVSPTSGPPGTLILLSGFEAGRVPTNAIVEIGGAPAPMVIHDDGTIASAIPLYIDEHGRMQFPAEPQDVVVKQGTKIIGQAPAAVEVTALPAANGATGQIKTALASVASAMRGIIEGCVGTPGVQGQYVYAIMAAADSMLQGNPADGYSISGAMSRIWSSPVRTQIADYLFSSSGVLERNLEWTQYLESIQPGMREGPSPSAEYASAGRGSYAYSAGSPIQANDDQLARMMEFHTIAGKIAEDEIAIGGSTYENTLTVMSALCAAAGVDPDSLAITFALILYFDQLVDNLILGTLPATLDDINLGMKYTTISSGDTTEASAVLTASNAGPATGLSSTIDVILQGLGGLQSSSMGQALRNCLLTAAQTVADNLQAGIASYAAQYPALQLNTNLESQIPSMQWRADASTHALYSLHTSEPSILIPCAGQINWYAPLSANGQAGVSLDPSDLPEAHLLPTPAGITYWGSFGDNTTGSDMVMVNVTSSAILRIDGSISPSQIPPNTSATLTVHATYHTVGGTMNAENVSLSLSTYNCSVGDANGYTDATGNFTTTVTPATNADSVCVSISASGTEGTTDSRTVCANVSKPPTDPFIMCAGDYMYFVAEDPYNPEICNEFVVRYAPYPDGLTYNVMLFFCVTNYDHVTHAATFNYTGIHSSSTGTASGNTLEWTDDPYYPNLYHGRLTITKADPTPAAPWRCECNCVLTKVDP